MWEKLNNEMLGKRFGRLVVIERHGKTKQGGSIWLCRCDCGAEKISGRQSLRRGHTQSCGCLLRENGYKQGKAHITHGMDGTRLYRVWAGMKSRCFDSNSSGYNNYGARGIRVCDEWRNSFVAFRDWALANGYRDDLTIERKDNNGNYEPGNCKWATRIEQSTNRSMTRFFKFKGELLSIAEIARRIAPNPCFWTLIGRIDAKHIPEGVELPDFIVSARRYNHWDNPMPEYNPTTV